MGAVHTNSLQTRELSPVRPEEPPGVDGGIQAESSRLRDVLVDEDHPVVAFGGRDLDVVQLRVEPVQVFGNPIVGQTFDEGESAFDQRLGSFSSLHLHDLLRLHVGPVDDVVDHVGGGGNDVFDVHLKTKRNFNLLLDFCRLILLLYIN